MMSSVDMVMMRRRSLVFRVTGSLLIGLAVTACSIERAPKPTNKVVVILDRSGTYQSRLGAAMGRVTTLLDAMAQSKRHRWEANTDQIVLISLDAMPEAIWQGSLRDLKGLDRAAWTSRLRGRSDYAHCTDVEAAFRLAAQHLEGDTRVVHKYLLVFSDLIAEPPTTSIGVCRAPSIPSVPSETFPWESLADVQTKVFWVPADQKLAWARAVAEQGLQERFALYTTSESASITLEPPAPPKVVRTEADRQASQQQIVGTLWTWLRGGAIAVVALAGVLFGAWWWLNRRYGQPRSPRPAGAPRRGTVPPLPASALRRPRGPNPGPQSRGPRPPFSPPSAPQRGERSTPNGHHDL